MRTIFLSAVLLSWFGLSAQELVQIPKLSARVTDLTGTLSGTETSALEQKLEALETSKGSQIVVVIVPTTKPEAIEQFGIRLAEAWKIGRKKIDDGAILIIAKEDRRMRIEVGYGLEGTLNDATCKRIIDEQIVPHFKKGDFAAGINAGVDAMIAKVQGEDLPPPVKGASKGKSSEFGHGPMSGKNAPSFGGLVIGLIVAGSVLTAFVSRLTSGLLVGAGGFLLGWLFLGLSMGLLLAIVSMIATWIFGGRMGGGGGGWSSGGSSGWSSGGSSFSGGGGSFGGGGSSGSW